MGGVLILLCIVVPTLLWSDLSNIFVWLTLGTTMAFGVIGFWDDYQKIRRQQNKGLTGRGKFLLQILVSFVFGVILVFLSRARAILHHSDLPLLQAPPPDFSDFALSREPLDVPPGISSLFALCYSGSGGFVQCRQSDGRTRRPGDWVLADFCVRLDRADLRGRTRGVFRVSRSGAPAARRRIDHFLRLDGGVQPGFPLVQRLPGGNFYGRRGLAGTWAERWALSRCW